MRPKRIHASRDPALLEAMLDAARLVVAFVSGRDFDRYLHDPLLRSAVERQVEIIGEAVRAVSGETMARAPHIPWLQIRAQRHRLAHEFGEVDHRVMWEIATVHAPRLVKNLEALLA